jgi:putative sterol carrier protein
MTTTPTADEMFGFIGATFEAARSNDQILAKMSGLQGKLKTITTEPDSVLIIDLATQEAREGSLDEDADATLRMSTTAANLFWQGELNMLAALTRGLVKLQGNKTMIVRVLPIATKLFPLYVQAVVDAGREDVLVNQPSPASS